VPSFAANSAAIAHALGEEVARIEEFIVLLQREQELLAHGAADPLLELIESKNSLANALTRLAQTRERILAELGLPAGRAGMEAWLENSGASADRQAWTHLLELAAQARELNATNGKLIGLQMQHNQQALAALMSAVDRVTTYGPDGQQQAAALGGRSFGKA